MPGRLCIHSSEDKSVKRPIFAVVIGINKYDSPSYDNLRAAAEDADRFSNYLTQNLAVFRDNIRNLRDENASRSAILDSISWLICHPEIKKNEAAIIIYFAGHGALINKDIQMICPSDIGTELPTCDGHTKIVEGISGSLLADHFTDLSNAKGSNITIFLDCCHSTGMIKPQTTIRSCSTENEANPLSEASVMFVEDLERYIVITACGRDMQAFESGSRKSGFFTSRLIDVLSSPEGEYLTYVSLIHQLGARMYMPDRQMPHCEGSPSRFYRQLYDLDPSMVGDASLVMTKRSEDSSIIFHAGSSNGIVEGLKLSVYANNLADPVRNPCLGELVVWSVDEFTSLLVCEPTMDSAITFPSLFYCKIDDSSTRKSTLLYSSDKFWLESVFPPDIQSRLSLNIADDDKNYDLRLNLLGEQVHFRQGTSFVTTHVPDHVWIVKKDEIDKIREVVKRYIHFYSCLELISPHNIREIGIELNELARKGNDFVSLHSCILGEDPIYISASSTKKYGLTLRNHTMDHFYPYLFCFDPMDLTIRTLYQPPTAAGEYGSTKKTDSPLLPSSEFTIGYGSSDLHGNRFRFELPQGQQVAITYLRLYLSSCPASFESMIREMPPFSDFNQRGLVPESEDDRLPRNRWMVKTATFVIHA